MNDYGKRGGTSATAGKKAEVISDAHGHYCKRVFKGQRWLAIARKDEADSTHVDAFTTERRAQAATDFSLNNGYMVAFVAPAHLVAVGRGA